MSPLFVDRAALFAELPAIRQQPSLTSPHAAPCRFDAIGLLTSADWRLRVGTGWGVSGWLVNGMQGVRVRAAARHCTSRSLAWHVSAIEASAVYLRRREWRAWLRLGLVAGGEVFTRQRPQGSVCRWVGPY